MDKKWVYIGGAVVLLFVVYLLWSGGYLASLGAARIR